MSQSYIYGLEKSKIPYLSLPDILRETVLERPDQEAVVFYTPAGERSSITYAEIYSKCQIFANWLISYGFERNSIVAISLKNCKEWLVCTLGTQLAGLIPLHLSSSTPIGNDVVDLLNKVGTCRALIVDSTNIDTFNKFIENKIPTLKIAIAINSLNDICEKGKLVKTAYPIISADDVCGIFLTSGSTGMPKAIPHTHRVMYLLGYNWGKSMCVQPGDTIYNDKPFTWVGSYPAIFLAAKVTVVTATDIMAMKSVNEINMFTISVLEKEKCVSAFLLPPCIHDMIQRNFPDCSIFPLRNVCTAGIPIDAYCAQIIGPMEQTFSNVYGSSEIGAISMITVGSPSEYENYEAGHPVEGIELKVVDDDGVIVPVGTTGEIYVRGRDRFQGYLNAKEKGEQCCDSTGWYITNDMGLVNQKGNIVVMGRKSDMMNIGGALVSPCYIESILKKHDSVENAFVFPIYNQQTFQEACAAIELKKGKSVTEDELHECFNEQKVEYSQSFIGNRCVPHKYVFFETFPKTHSGKLDRMELKANIVKLLESKDIIHI